MGGDGGSTGPLVAGVCGTTIRVLFARGVGSKLTCLIYADNSAVAIPM